MCMWNLIYYVLKSLAHAKLLQKYLYVDCVSLNISSQSFFFTREVQRDLDDTLYLYWKFNFKFKNLFQNTQMFIK